MRVSYVRKRFLKVIHDRKSDMESEKKKHIILQLVSTTCRRAYTTVT